MSEVRDDPQLRYLQSAFAAAHERVLELIDDFEQHSQRYLQPDYQEAEARKDFIDPFLKALDWDVDHDRERNPYEQEVKVERGVSVARSQKRADYAFYLKPNFRDVRFFVEAKKPSIDLTHSTDAHFQTWRYGYSANTPLAILTDFEQVHVLDCRARPQPDAALDRVWKKWHYTEFRDPEKFAEFYWLFSREAHADGSFQRRIDELPKPRGGARQRGLFRGGYQTVDESFLAELEEHREALAKAFKKADHALDSETLTAIVQRALDRLVFLRFLEDKQIETEIRVSDFGRGGSAWRDFVNASRRLDGIYNGIVFKREPPLDDAAFAPDDAVFADVCEKLAAENSPYNFDAIPIHILGSIYERFLGSLISTTAARVKIEQKPEVRKAGGVYYTPEYIVRYIVAQTVGKLIEGKSPAEIAKLRFADIACGSGSFLLGIFDELLRHHAEWYNRPENEKAATKKGTCVRGEDGRFRLSLAQRRTILLNNIYGVDIDRQAVEVAQLSLFLKLLEDERAVSARQYQLDYARDPNLKKLLPDLSSNIVCGNSLVGWDVADLAGLSPEDERRLNPLDFADAFKNVIRNGGFDAIVGNPPYVQVSNEIHTDAGATYFAGFRVAEYKIDLFHLFIERAIGLLHSGAKLGYIVPNPWLTLKYNQKLRAYVLETCHIDEIVVQSHQVFDSATVHTCLLFLTVGETNSSEATHIKITDGSVRDSDGLLRWPFLSADQRSWKANELQEFETRRLGREGELVEKVLARGVALESVARASLGCQAYNSSKHTKAQIEQRVFHSETKLSDEYLPELAGSDVSRYSIKRERGKWIKYGPWLHDYRTMDWLSGPRVLVREICGSPPYSLQAAYVEDTYCNYKTILNVSPKADSLLSMKFVAGVLNSKLISFVYPLVSNKIVAESFPRLSVRDLKKLPLPNLDLARDKSRHDQMVSLVDQMLEARKQEAAASGQAKEIAARKCTSLDHRIDALVYELYGLTDEEIALVERGSP